MNKSKSDKTFLDAINRRLDLRVADIDLSTKTQLRKIRQQALAQAAKKPRIFWSWLKPAPLMTAVSLVLVLGVSLRMTMDITLTPTPALEDIPLLTATDDIEFYNDLDFYQWLEAENLNG